MNDTKKHIEDFKKVLHHGMIKSFEADGCLAPIVFFYKDDKPIISEIPNDLLNSSEGKIILADMIKTACLNPTTRVAGIIIEAYGVKLDEKQDSDINESIKRGEIRVSELDEKQDIIIMIFSTPNSEEFISYCVDPKTKTVGEEFIGESADVMAGTFSKFFNWSKN